MILSPKQQQLATLDLPNYEIVTVSGPTGTGKSFAANLAVYHQLVSSPPRSVYLLTGNTYAGAYSNLIQPMLEIDQGIGDLDYGTENGVYRLLSKKNKSRAYVYGGDNKKAENRVRGLPKVRGWCGDEATLNPPTFIQGCLSRLRYEEDGILKAGWSLLTFNPDHPYHPIKVEYMDKAHENPGYKNMYFGFPDNPTIGPEYLEKLKKRFHGVFYERMISGLWVAAEGAVYREFDPSIHIIDSYDESFVIEYLLGVDWGYDNPMSIGLFAKMWGGEYILIDEFYERFQLIDNKFIDKLKTKGWFSLQERRGLDKPAKAYCDPARPDYIQQFRNLSGIVTLGANNEVVEGIQTVQNGFAHKKLFFMRHCINHIREHQSYIWETRAGDYSKDEPVKKDDHSCDSTRYMKHSDKGAYVTPIGKSPFRK